MVSLFLDILMLIAMNN